MIIQVILGHFTCIPGSYHKNYKQFGLKTTILHLKLGFTLKKLTLGKNSLAFKAQLANWKPREAIASKSSSWAHCRNIFTNNSTLLSKHTRGGKSENVKENFNFKLEPILLQKYIGFSKFHYKEYREAIASKKYLGLRTNSILKVT